MEVLNDKTKVAGTKWRELKHRAMEHDFKESEEWHSMSKKQQILLERLIGAQHA